MLKVIFQVDPTKRIKVHCYPAATVNVFKLQLLCCSMVKMLLYLCLKHYFLCRHFDKDKTGYLEHREFKSCLRSLGYDLPMVEEGETDPEFDAILATVDPNG